MTAIRLILLDIEGTTLPIAFVRDVLFPYAERTLPELLATQADQPLVRTALADIAHESPGRDPMDQIREWTAKDVKAAPLKTLQGLAWRSGFESGALRADLYPDVPGVLRAWHDHGLRLEVYSSGSASAQKLLYGYSSAGDLTPLFEAFHDLSVGGKKVAESYTEIASRAGVPPAEILFLSDVGAELDAAREAGCQICQLIRLQDGTQPYPGVPHAGTLAEVASRFGLPVT